MTPEEVMNTINFIEENFCVTKWSVKDIDIWPLIRIDLANSLTKNYFSKKPVKTYKKVIKSLYVFLIYGLKTKSCYIGRNKRADVSIFTDMAYREKVAGTYYSKISDYFNDEFMNAGYKVQIYENNHSALIRLPVYSSVFFISPFLLFRKLLANYAIVFNKNYVKKLEHLEGYVAFITFLENEFGKEVSRKFSSNRVVKKIIFVNLCSRYFAKLFRRSDTKLNLIVCYYSLIGYAFCHASHRLNIPCYDIQHGIVGKLHRAYGNWVTAPDKGFNTMPSGFWLWSKNDKVTVNCKQRYKPHLIYGGNVWNFFWKNSNSVLIKKEKEKYENFIKTFKKYEKVILVTLQFPHIPSLVKKLTYKTSNKVLWLFRAHPRLIEVTSSQFDAFSKQSNIHFEKSSIIPLNLLLPYVDIHITMSSAVVLDAATFFKRSIVITKEGKDYFQNLIDNGECFYSESENEILNLINSVKNNEIYRNKGTVINSKKAVELLKNTIAKSVS